MAGLTASEIDAYRRDGLVVPSFRLGEATLERLGAGVERLVAANPDVPPEYLIGPHIARPDDRDPKLYREFLDLCLDPGILDLVESVIGPDIILWSSGVFASPRARGAVAPGRAVAPAPPRDLLGLGRDRRLAARERLHALHPGSTRRGVSSGRQSRRAPRVPHRPAHREAGRNYSPMLSTARPARAI